MGCGNELHPCGCAYVRMCVRMYVHAFLVMHVCGFMAETSIPISVYACTSASVKACVYNVMSCTSKEKAQCFDKQGQLVCESHWSGANLVL